MTIPEVLALIPARGGSKGIPRKNIRPFAGYPLIAYSIAAAYPGAERDPCHCVYRRPGNRRSCPRLWG